MDKAFRECRVKDVIFSPRNISTKSEAAPLSSSRESISRCESEADSCGDVGEDMCIKKPIPTRRREATSMTHVTSQSSTPMARALPPAADVKAVLASYNKGIRRRKLPESDREGREENRRCSMGTASTSPSLSEAASGETTTLLQVLRRTVPHEDPGRFTNAVPFENDHVLNAITRCVRVATFEAPHLKRKSEKLPESAIAQKVPTALSMVDLARLRLQQ